MNRRSELIAGVLGVLCLALIIGHMVIQNGRTPEDDLEDLNQVEEVKSNMPSKDEIIDRFVAAYNARYSDKITDIRRGNIRTKYSGTIKGYSIDMINANNAAAESFNVTINNKHEEPCSDDIYEIYGNILRIIDSALTDTQIYDSISTLKNTQQLSQFQLNDISVDYAPMIDQPCQAASHLGIRSKNYK